MSAEAQLVGSQVRLRPAVKDDVAELAAIRRTPEVWARWRGDDLEAELRNDLADDGLHLYVIDIDGRTGGAIQFFEEDDPDYRHATIDVYLDPSLHGRGLGTDAVSTIVRHLFSDRGHHRVTIDPNADNAAAIRCYTKAGFRPVGVLHQYERQPDGSWGDALFMELLRSP